MKHFNGNKGVIATSPLSSEERKAALGAILSTMLQRTFTVVTRNSSAQAYHPGENIVPPPTIGSILISIPLKMIFFFIEIAK